MTQRLIVNVTTGEETYVDLTAEEEAEREASVAEDLARREAEKAAADKKAEDKASGEAKLAELGLSADEIAALVG